MFRRRSTAASDDARAGIEQRAHCSRELLRTDIEDGLAVFHMGQAGIGLSHERAAHTGCHGTRSTGQLGRTERAVETDRLRAERTFERIGYRGFQPMGQFDDFFVCIFGSDATKQGYIAIVVQQIGQRL